MNYSIYTPNNIAEIMADKILDKYFNDITSKKLDEIRICDLSVGSGNLIIPILEKLIIISKKITGKYEYNDNWITGYDIDEDALEIARFRIKELLGKYNLKIKNKLNIEKKDSLEIENKKFNIIIGNPPYLGEKNNKEIFKSIKNTSFGKKFYEAKMDYFYFFIEKAIELLSPNGLLIYLTTNYWLKADSASILRNFLKENGNFLEMIYYDDSLFDEALGQSNIIFMWQKQKNNDKIINIINNNEKYFIKNSEIYDENNKIILANKEQRNISHRIKEKSNFYLKDLININQGIISGCDKAFVFSEFDIRFKDYLKPFYKNKDIGNYNYDKNKFWILYLDKFTKITKELEEYLLNYKDKLVSRREVRLDRISWWELTWARNEEIFNNEKILVRQRCKENRFAYSDGIFYGSADIYFLTKKNKSINLFYILGYLNSKVFLKWYEINGKFKGRNFEFYSTPLKETPIFYPNNEENIKYIEKLVKKQIENYDEKIQKEIDKYFNDIYLKK